MTSSTQLLCILQDSSSNYSCIQKIKPFVFWFFCSLDHQESNAQAHNNIFVSGLPVSTTLVQLSQKAQGFQREVNEHKI